VVALFALGFERRNFFELRYFTSTIPMLLLFLARMAASCGRGRLTRVLLLVVVLASLGWGLVDQQVNQSNPRTYDFRGAVLWVQSRSQSDDLLVYAPKFLDHELAYYPAGIKPSRPSASTRGAPPRLPRYRLAGARYSCSPASWRRGRFRAGGYRPRRSRECRWLSGRPLPGGQCDRLAIRGAQAMTTRKKSMSNTPYRKQATVQGQPMALRGVAGG
jgi:hypothetical protein